MNNVLFLRQHNPGGNDPNLLVVTRIETKLYLISQKEKRIETERKKN
jgi:hypothetical protein